MFLDVDNFKMVNDRHGHLFGDEVLCRIAGEINKQFRSDDIICLYWRRRIFDHYA